MSRMSTRSNGVICPSCRRPVRRMPRTIARYTTAVRSAISRSGAWIPRASVMPRGCSEAFLAKVHGEEGGEQAHGSLHVAKIHHLGDGVDITAGYGNAAGRHALSNPMNAGSIGGGAFDHQH